MNLPTHWVAALAIGIAFFHNVELAFIMSMGALIPDLDREYFYVARDFIGRHQTHRAVCHNFLVAGILFLVSPLLALGALSHYFLDIFTSASDRGVELLWPFTRFFGGFRFLWTIEGDKKNGAKKLKWWVEDPWRLLKNTTERDLQEPEEQPWRRSYGPFKNGRIVDWGIFFTSIVFLIFLAASAFALGTNFYSLTEPLSLSSISLLALGFFFSGVLVFFGLGEWYQRQPDEKKEETAERLTALLIFGLILLVAAGILGWIGGIFLTWIGWIGGIFFLSLPSFSTLIVFGAAIIAIVFGFAISYAYNRMTKDLTI
jgi:hypothetical protein